MRFSNGLFIGFTWVYGGDGTSSHTSAALAGYHRPDSITWRWALYWGKPGKFTWRMLYWTRNPSGYNWIALTLPFIGSFTLHVQPHMIREATPKRKEGK